uniref:Secreted protein n=1 Tax=Ixodes ricinus TaxID=34613 RepID=A0A6B0U9R2_IXORI
MSWSTWAIGVVVVVAVPMASSKTAVLTSRSSNCCSNFSMTADTFCRSIELMALSSALTTPAMFLVTCFMAMALLILEETASTLEAIRR